MKGLQRWLLTVGLLVASIAPAHGGDIYLHAVQAHYADSGTTCLQNTYNTAGGSSQPYYTAFCAAGADRTTFFHVWFPSDAGLTWTPRLMLRNSGVSSGQNSCWKLESAVAKLPTAGGNYDAMTYGGASTATHSGTTGPTTGLTGYVAMSSFVPFNGINGVPCDSSTNLCKNMQMVIKVTRLASCSNNGGAMELDGLHLNYN